MAEKKNVPTRDVQAGALLLTFQSRSHRGPGPSVAQRSRSRRSLPNQDRRPAVTIAPGAARGGQTSVFGRGAGGVNLGPVIEPNIPNVRFPRRAAAWVFRQTESPRMLLTRRSVFLPLVSILVACAHDFRKDPEVIAAVRGHRAWLDQLPRCRPGATAIEVGGLRGLRDPGSASVASEHPIVAVRGLLTLARVPLCTKMACLHTACCNGCDIPWVLVPSSGPLRGHHLTELQIREHGDKYPMAGGAMDCQVSALQALVPEVEVIATGKLVEQAIGGTVLDASSLCVMEHPPITDRR